MSYIKENHYFDVFVFGPKSSKVSVRDQAAELREALDDKLDSDARVEMSRVSATLGKGWILKPSATVAAFSGDVSLPLWKEPVFLGAALKKMALKYPSSTFVATDFDKNGQFSVFISSQGSKNRRFAEDLDAVSLRLQSDTWGWCVLGLVAGRLPKGVIVRTLKDADLTPPVMREFSRFPNRKRRRS